MELTEIQYQRIADCLPRQRGNVSMTNLRLLNALLYVTEHGCKWRGLPKYLGNWHTIYTRMNRWSKAGVLDRVFARLQQEQIIAIKFEAVSLDSTTVKVHPDGTGALKNGAASHRPLPWGLHDQDSSGCRACPVRPEFFAIPGASGGCAAGTGTVARWRTSPIRLPSDHGSGLRG